MKKNTYKIFTKDTPKIQSKFFVSLGFFWVVCLSVLSCHMDKNIFIQQYENLFSTKKIEFTFSQDSLKEEIEKIIFIDSNNCVQEFSIKKDSDRFQKIFNNNCILLDLRENEITPVLVFLKNTMYPLGAIYPYSKNISSKEGFSAKILFRFLNETKSTNPKLLKEYISTFNWQKFCDKANTFENPWNLNQEIILESLAKKTFSAKCFQLLQLE